MKNTALQSMTGFGSSELNGCRVEIRSINHKFLDIFMRMPPYMNQFDITFRNLIKQFFSRGKIDVTITAKGQASAELSVNTDLVRQILAAFRAMQKELSISGDIDVNTLVGLHEMFIEKGEKFEAEALAEIFRLALEDLQKMRVSEGVSLSLELLKMIGNLEKMNGQIKAASGGLASAAVSKFTEKLKLLLENSDLDENRILQEAAIIAARMDISEEIARIESHLKQFKEIIAKGGIIGRKLDFVLQELNREVNTVASKSADYDLSSLTVEMKTEIEKIREQVQNLQ